ncbi:hypothetical protein AVEN_10379-1, partial [Araneus ventricosus]
MGQCYTKLFVKSWKKLWPNLADSSKVERREANKSEILPRIECIPGCEDATEHTVTEQLSCDTEANQLYTDEEIISLVQNKTQDDSDLEETNEPENVLVSHSEAPNALEIALRYIKQSENASSTDIMFMRRHNIASTSRIISLRQTNLTNFFTPKECKCGLFALKRPDKSTFVKKMGNKFKIYVSFITCKGRVSC